MKRSIEDALAEAKIRIGRDDFVRAILTGSRKSRKPHYQRVDLRPVAIKGRVMIQSVAHDGKKDVTQNYDLAGPEILSLLDSGFANIIVDTTTESFQIQITKKEEAVTGLSKTKLERILDHDRIKERLLPESHPVFRALEMSDASGRIKPSARDKYIQIDQFLRSLEPTLEVFAKGSQIRLVDLASGSAALTLAVHAFLAKDYRVETLGIERNPDLVKKSTEVAETAGLPGITFVTSEIASAPRERVDIVMALHACDRATDEAIDYVIESDAKVALVVPCCHQSRSAQVVEIAKRFEFFGRDGIVDERILDLATDALRGERLREARRRVDIIEFVGDEHTARNILIRAVLE